MNLIELIVIIVVFIMLAGFFTYAYGFVTDFFPGIFVWTIMLIILIQIVKVIIGRDND